MIRIFHDNLQTGLETEVITPDIEAAVKLIVSLSEHIDELAVDLVTEDHTVLLKISLILP